MAKQEDIDMIRKWIANNPMIPFHQRGVALLTIMNDKKAIKAIRRGEAPKFKL